MGGIDNPVVADDPVDINDEAVGIALASSVTSSRYLIISGSGSGLGWRPQLGHNAT